VELAVIVKVAKSSVLETSFAAVRRHGNVITSSEIRRSSPCGLQLSKNYHIGLQNLFDAHQETGRRHQPVKGWDRQEKW